ncbi:capsular polysaccharide biosynthesis protein [Acinetobacter sp. NIPH1876]|uniref:capsular polysaccharide biosynthesis protein n=1 Tax=Acinetobacter sp. NIPH1876 TaxID=2924041 RepID=UPI001FAC24DD|nr:capsular polysaccharide biosynthesis protein [Acinetobacter sp. NIPH1876]MCJ0829605.1 capsular polysaccharide biosynthesis protein [Acinetobacter sp. NIPH1876]
MILCSKKIRKIPAIEQFVGEEVSSLMSRFWKESQNFGGWGRKPSSFRAEKHAQKYETESVCLEDGFIRSLGLGKQGSPPLSIVLDRSGIYFDASQISDLEKLIVENNFSKQQLERSQALIKRMVVQGITKYNLQYEPLDSSIFHNKKNILVVDQTFGDQSIHYAMASTDRFHTMLHRAIADHPDATIWVKIHPDVIAGKATGHFSFNDLTSPNIELLKENYNPIELCKQMSEVYVVSSQLGFEALLCGKPVHCFGWPWYAGWGLTQDCQDLPDSLKTRRNISRSLEQLFVAAYLNYAKYVSPVSQRRCELEEVIDVLIPNIEFQKQLTASSVVAYGFSRWKKSFIKDFLAFPHITLRFRQWLKPKKDQPIVAWGKKAALLKQQGFQQVWTVEDGFLRSLGLGAKLIRPYSLVFDDIGIYYDACHPSRLENLLNQVQLNEDQLYRIQSLIQKIIQNKLTKYNVGQALPEASQIIDPDKKVILVVGQVEDDLSIQLGGYDIKTNLDLIKEVRSNNPNAHIIYKPHPDVESGLRKGKIIWDEIKDLVEHIEVNQSIITLFEHIDELHTITSLSGFEALLRNITVYCYGMPFYAGWGLTCDRHSCERRQRKLTVEELAFCALVEYPIYNLPQTNPMQIPLVTPELVIEHLCKLQQRAGKSPSSVWSWMFTRLRALKIKF